MKVTLDIKYDSLTHTKFIENIEVVYKKKKKYIGKLSSVKLEPFVMSILDE